MNNTPRYHISPETGRPNICKANVRDCPVGGQHFASKQEAREGYEKDNNSFSPSLKKSKTQYAENESVFPGMGYMGKASASANRMAVYPAVTYEDRESDHGWVTDVYANGKKVFTAKDRKDQEVFERVVQAGKFQELDSALQYNADIMETMDYHLLGEGTEKEITELKEEIDYMHYRKDNRPKWEKELSGNEKVAADFEIEVAQIALDVLKTELKKNKAKK